MNREVIKYTLKSYLGDHINTTPHEQKLETIGKVNNLSVKDFDTFVGDIVNEIHRRTDLEFKQPGKHSMRKRLVQMKEETFKNLVFDALEVYNTRYPSDTDNVEDDIDNISKLISKLKTEEDINEQIFSETNISLKYKYFLEYVRNKYITKEDKIFEHMAEFTNNNITEEIDDSCDIIFNYKLLIDKLNTSKYANLDKYKIYNENIKRLENMSLEKVTKKELIAGEFFNIIKLIIENQYFYEEDVIKRNVMHIINTIQGIDYLNKDSLEAMQNSKLRREDCADIKMTISNILENCQDMPFVDQLYISKLKSFTSKETLLYEDITVVVNLIRNILEDIKRKNV